MGIRPVFWRTDVAAGEGQVHDRGHVVGAPLVLRDPHRPDQHGRLRRAVHAGEALHVGAGRARLPLEIVERLAFELGEEVVESFGVFAHEVAVDAPVGEQHLEDTVEERDVAAGVHVEELVGHLGAEHRALGVARDPVALEPWLAHRVHHHDLGPTLARDIQVLHEHRLCVRDVRAEQDDELRTE